MKSRLVVHSCNNKGADGVGNEKDGGGDGVFTVCPISFEDLNIFSIFLLNFVY